MCSSPAPLCAGGERILDVFEIKLKEAIQKLPFQKILTLKNVQSVVNEADGYQPHIIAPENGYRCVWLLWLATNCTPICSHCLPLYDSQIGVRERAWEVHQV